MTAHLKLIYSLTNIPVKYTEEGVHHTKDKEFLKQQLVNAPLPPKEQLGEASKLSVGNFKGVGNRHGWFEVWHDKTRHCLSEK